VAIYLLLLKILSDFYLTLKLYLIMKKLFMLVAFLGLVNFVQAQCTKTASTTGTKSACCAKTADAAAKAASMDESIEKRVCEKSGAVSYVKKEVCAVSGNVSFTNVEYCTKSEKFVNVSPSEAKAVNASMETEAKPACSKSKAACTKSKEACSKTTKTAATETDEVKPAAVKVSNDQ
jgi:hypothetical protein